MIIIGMDVGIFSTKVTLWCKGKILANAVIPAAIGNAEQVAKKAIEQAKKIAGVYENTYYAVVTGHGKSLIPIANETISDAVCLARGIYELMPSVHSILDLGLQKTLAVKCSNGYPSKMVTSAKCASGAGSYLQVVSDVLEIPIGEMGELSLNATETIEIDSMCAVFAESEIISLLHNRIKVEDILSGIYKSLAKRIYSLLLRIGIDRELALVGGMAQDRGLRHAIETQIGHKILVPDQTMFVGSLGAAIIGGERAEESHDYCWN